MTQVIVVFPMPTASSSFAAVRGPVIAVLIWFLLPKARAEEALTYKFQSWQEDDGRIRVDSHYGLLESDLTPDLKFKLMGLIDNIAGATPTGEPPTSAGGQVPLTQLTERRKAWEADLTRQIKRVNLAVGYSQSRESDYISKGWSVNTLTDFNDKNTSLLLGYARTDDRIQSRAMPEALPKTGNDIVVGVNQLLSPVTSLSVDLTYGKSHGFLNDPYKLVLKTYDFFGTPFPVTFSENRPDEKDKVVLFVGLNRSFEAWHGALDGSYRFYHDGFGIDSHTLSLEWLQKISDRWILSPSVRLYRQTAADFYYPQLDGTTIDPEVNPVGQAPYYSSDFRLAAMDTVNLGLKLVWRATDWLSVDASYERYLMHGRDATPSSAFVNADVFTIGIKLTR